MWNSYPTSNPSLQESLDTVVTVPAGLLKLAQLEGINEGCRSSLNTNRCADEFENSFVGVLSVVKDYGEYKDYSRVMPQNRGTVSFTHTTSTKEPTFPVKLHMILSNPEYEDIITWLPHGRSWRILQQKAFEERVIPRYFRHGQYSSFSRQVNGWGFRRVTQGPDYGSYYNELFLRGMAHLCEKMTRLSCKAYVPAPDFYAISKDNPLPELLREPKGGEEQQFGVPLLHSAITHQHRTANSFAQLGHFGAEGAGPALTGVDPSLGEAQLLSKYSPNSVGLSQLVLSNPPLMQFSNPLLLQFSNPGLLQLLMTKKNAAHPKLGG
jgi:hypothetical protein